MTDLHISPPVANLLLGVLGVMAFLFAADRYDAFLSRRLRRRTEGKPPSQTAAE